MITGSQEGDIRLWHIDGSLVSELRGAHKSKIHSIKYNHKNSMIGSLSIDGTVHLWKLKNDHLNRFLKLNLGSARSLAFDPKRNILITGHYDGMIYFWNISEGGKLINKIKAHQEGINTLITSIDGKKLFSGADDATIRVWSIDKSKLLTTLKGHDKRVLSLSISDKILASASSDNMIYIWDTEHGIPIRKLEGHTDWVYSLSFRSSFYPDKGLASASADKTIKLWNIETGEIRQSLKKHNDFIYSLAYSTDENILASGSADGTIRIWDDALLINNSMFEKYDPHLVSEALQFVWKIGLNKEKLKFVQKSRESLRLDYGSCRTDHLDSLLAPPKPGKSKIEQLVGWLEAQKQYARCVKSETM